MKILHTFLFIVTIKSIKSLDTFLNVDELNSIYYDIDILKKPVLKVQNDWKESITMVNKHGQEYICKLPEIYTSQTNKKDENILDQLTDISELLKPMEAAPCLVKTKDWWTYEFCYGSVIKQYHLEDNIATGPILILGKYENEYNWKNSSETKNKLQRFHSQFYVNGTKCDITGEPRRAEVRFYCDDSMGDSIKSVDEPESCRYVVTVATTRVCHHPYLRPQTTTTPHTISCHPALTQEQFDRYEKQQEIKFQRAAKEIKLATDTDDTSLDSKGSKSENDEEEAKFKIHFLMYPPDDKEKNFYDLFNEALKEPEDGNRHSEKSNTDKLDFEEMESTEDKSNAEAEDLSMEEKPDDLSSKDFDDEIINVPENKNSPSLDYLDESDILETEYQVKDTNILDSKDNGKEFEEIEQEKEDTEEEELPRKEEIARHYAKLNGKLDKLIDSWVENKNINQLEEVIKMSDELEKSAKSLQENAAKIEGPVFQLVKEIDNIGEKIKETAKDEEKDNNEEKLNSLISTLYKTLGQAAVEVKEAKQQLSYWEEYVDKHLKDIHEDNEIQESSASEDISSTPESQPQDPLKDSSSSPNNDNIEGNSPTQSTLGDHDYGRQSSWAVHSATMPYNKGNGLNDKALSQSKTSNRRTFLSLVNDIYGPLQKAPIPPNILKPRSFSPLIIFDNKHLPKGFINRLNKAIGLKPHSHFEVEIKFEPKYKPLTKPKIPKNVKDKFYITKSVSEYSQANPPYNSRQSYYSNPFSTKSPIAAYSGKNQNDQLRKKSAKHKHRKLPRSKFDENAKDAEQNEPKSDTVSSGTNTRQLRILKGKNIDESHKTKLEKSIGEKFKKLRIEHFGQNIEVKILTPNYLDDDDGRDPLKTLSKEERDAFQNMIVNILSKNARELDEREKHRNMEENYNFRLEDLYAETLSEDEDSKGD